MAIVTGSVLLTTPFYVFSILYLLYIFYKKAELAILNVKFDFSFQVITFICVVAVVLVVVAIMIFVPLVPKGLHLQRWAEDCFFL